jgi:amino acid transporter
MLLLIGMGFVAWARFGSATPITAHALLPSTGLRDMVFWSTIAFAFTGLEAGSFMGEEIVDPRRTISRAVLIAGISIAIIYILGTLAIMLALPQAEITGLGGIMDAITATGVRIGLTGLAPVAATLIVLNTLGGVGVWLAAPARLPFVAGIDHYLPSAFGRLHPRYGTPHVALLMQAGVAAACAILGQAGETPKQAYDILVSLGVVAFFIPYITMFAAMIRLQREPAGPEVVRPPGGRPMAILLGWTGLATSVAAVLLACVPPPGEEDGRRYVIKVVGLSALLVASGVLAWVVGNARRRSARAIG